MKFLNDLKTQLLDDYRNNKTVLILECFGTAYSFIGATVLAIMEKDANLFIVFGFYFLGSLFWAIAAKKRNNSLMTILSGYYTIINALAILKLFY